MNLICRILCKGHSYSEIKQKVLHVQIPAYKVEKNAYMWTVVSVYVE